jgi:hypothetical protein
MLQRVTLENYGLIIRIKLTKTRVQKKRWMKSKYEISVWTSNPIKPLTQQIQCRETALWQYFEQQIACVIKA